MFPSLVLRWVFLAPSYISLAPLLGLVVTTFFGHILWSILGHIAWAETMAGTRQDKKEKEQARA